MTNFSHKGIPLHKFALIREDSVNIYFASRVEPASLLISSLWRSGHRSWAQVWET